jgi:predicted NUDIX family NTP pyrophosphohydrolase
VALVISAGILLFRRVGETFEVLLAHPGGPVWAGRDAGAWSIPKGELDEGDEPLAVARREFSEEVGSEIACSKPHPLGSVQQKSGKVVYAWACEGDVDPLDQLSNTFRMEWPPKSETYRDFPEVDRVEWFAPDAARRKLNPAQAAFIDRLEESFPHL